jgi:hypothetical protein
LAQSNDSSSPSHPVEVAESSGLPPSASEDLQPSTLPSSLGLFETSDSPIQLNISSTDHPPALSPNGSVVNSTYQTSANAFGLFRIFNRACYPSHDPDATVTFQSLCDDSLSRWEGEQVVSQVPSSSGVPEPATSPMSIDAPSNPDPSSSFYPYPNRSSFELGDWYWRRGALNSMAGFQELCAIIAHQEFKADDIRSTSWAAVHRLLPHGNRLGFDGQDADSTPNDDGVWVDDLGPGWTSTKIQLDVPFPNRGRGATVLKFPAGTLHHRNILSVIKDKIANSGEHSHRRYSSFKLMWKPTPRAFSSDSQCECYRWYA